MKYRNFDPITDQPISADKLLHSISESNEIKLKTFNISQAISQSKTTPSDEDLTAKFLKRFNKIATIINKSATKKGANSRLKDRDNLNEFDKYLKNKYPLADIKTEEKLTLLLKKRIEEIINEKN